MARRSDAGMALLRTIGPSTWRGNGFWAHPWLVRDALCQDGRRRTVYLGQDADTYFSWPGRAKIGGRWVRGSVAITHEDDAHSDTVFHSDIR